MQGEVNDNNNKTRVKVEKTRKRVNFYKNKSICMLLETQKKHIKFQRM